MPTYNYRCTRGHVFELFHGIRDEKSKRCPRCGARARRVPSGGTGLLFKGSGFYITDYRSAAYREKASQDKPSSGTEGGKDKSAKTSDTAKKPPSGRTGGGKKPPASE